jgi:hypothetical protein
VVKAKNSWLFLLFLFFLFFDLFLFNLLFILFFQSNLLSQASLQSFFPSSLFVKFWKSLSVLFYLVGIVFTIFVVPWESIFGFLTFPSLGERSRADCHIKHIALRYYNALDILSKLEIIVECLLKTKWSEKIMISYILPSIFVAPLTTTFFLPLILLVNNSTL